MMRSFSLYITIIMLLLTGVVYSLFLGPMAHLRFPGLLWTILFPYLLTLFCGGVVCKAVDANNMDFVSVFLKQLVTKFLLMMVSLVVFGLVLRAHAQPALLTLFFVYILFSVAESVWLFRKSKQHTK